MTKRLNLEWNDPRLAWNESHANGIQDVRLNINDIWLPDIEIYNLVSKKALRREGEEQVSNLKLSFSFPDLTSGGFEKHWANHLDPTLPSDHHLQDRPHLLSL